MKKRLTSVLLALIMLVNLLPVGVFAEEISLLSEDAAPSLNLEMDKNGALSKLGLSTEAPEGINNDGNPYGKGKVAVTTYSELFLNRSKDGSNEFTLYDRDKSDQTNLFGFALSLVSSYFKMYSVSATESGAFMAGKYARTWSGDFNGEGKANYIAQVSLAGQQGGRLALNILDARTGATLASRYLTELDFKNGKDGYLNVWEAVAFLSAATGDFSGTGKDQIAVYVPSAADNGANRVEIYSFDASTSSINFEREIVLPDSLKNGELKKDAQNYLSVQLAGGDITGDGIDDLVVTTSINRKSTIVGGNASDAYSQMMIYHADGTGALNLKSTVKLQYKTNGSDTLYNVRSASAAIGDINGDGKNDITVAGNVSLTTSWNLRVSDDKTPEVAIAGYNENGVCLAGSITNGVNVGGWTVHAGAAKKNGDIVRVYTTDEVNSPVALTTFKAKGDGYPEAIFLDGAVYDFDGVAFNKNADASDCIRNKIVVENRRTCLWFSDAVAGNFDNDPTGRESVMFVHSQKFTGKNYYYHYVCSIGQSSTEAADWSGTNWSMPDQKKMTLVSITPVDTDNDSMIMEFVSKDYYFTDPKIIAVMQASPYFEDLTSMDDGYASNGSTEITKSSSEGTSDNHSVSISAGVVMGMEQEISFFGMGSTGFEFEASVIASAGYNYQKDVEKTHSVTISSPSDEDRVALTMIPYVRYRYNMFVPEYKLMTSSEYSEKKAQMSALESRLKALTTNDTEYEKLANEFYDLYEVCAAMDEAMQKGHTWGETIKAHTEEYVMSFPGTARTTIITVDQYDAVASQYEDMDVIRGNVFLDTYQKGEVSTYRSGTAGLSEVESAKDVGSEIADWLTVRPAGLASMTQEISGSESISKGASWGVAYDFEFSISVGGAKGGIHVGAEYEGGHAKIDTSGYAYTGTVSHLPMEAEGYTFDWKFIAYPATLNGSGCIVMEYLTKNVVAPPSIPANIRVEETTLDSVTLAWEAGTRAAESYSIYRYIPNASGTNYILIGRVDGATTSFTDNNCKENTEYTYVLQANSLGKTSARSNPITAKTLTQFGVPKVAISGPNEVLAGLSATLHSTVERVEGGTTPVYTWQYYGTSGWVNLSQASTYTVPVVTADNEGTRYRCVVSQFVSGDYLEGISNTYTLQVGRNASNTSISVGDSVGLANGVVANSVTEKVVLKGSLTVSFDSKLYDVLENNGLYYIQSGDKVLQLTDPATLSAIAAKLNPIMGRRLLRSETPVSNTNIELSVFPETELTENVKIILAENENAYASEFDGGYTTGKLNDDILCENYRTLEIYKDGETTDEETGELVTTPVLAYTVYEAVFEDGSAEYYLLNKDGETVSYTLLEADTVYFNDGTEVDLTNALNVEVSWEEDITSESMTAVQGTALSLVATVSENNDTLTPTGQVQFEITNLADTTSKIYVPATLEGGTASATWTPTGAGVYSIRAIFAGDANLLPSASDTASYLAYITSPADVTSLSITGPNSIIYGSTLGGMSVQKVSCDNDGEKITSENATGYTVKILNSDNEEIEDANFSSILTPGVYSIIVTLTEGEGDAQKTISARHQVTVNKKPIDITANDIDLSLNTDTVAPFSGQEAEDGDVIISDTALVSGDTWMPAFFTISSGLAAQVGLYPVTVAYNTEATGDTLAALVDFQSKYQPTFVSGIVTVTEDSRTVTYSVGTNGSVDATYSDQAFPFKSGQAIATGSLVSIVAYANAGWEVDKWTVNGTAYSAGKINNSLFSINGETLSFELNENMDISVSFKVQSNSLVFGAFLSGSSSDRASISAAYANGGAKIASGDQVQSSKSITLTANVAEGYVIDSWEIIEGSGEGKTEQTAAGADYNGSMLTLDKVTKDTVVKLHLAAAVEYEVLYRASSANETLTDYSVTATNVSDGEATRGATIEFTAVDSANAVIEKWIIYPSKEAFETGTGGSILSSAASSYIFENLRGNLYVEAVFAAIGERTAYKLSYSVTGDNGESILTARDAGGNLLQNGRRYVKGTAVSFELDLHSTYYVVEWTGAVVSESDPTKATLASLNGDTVVSVVVAAIPTETFNITYSYGLNGTATASYGDPAVPFTGSADILIGRTVSVVAVPDAGWKVAEWTVNGETYTIDSVTEGFEISGNTLSFVANANMTIAVTFEVESFDLAFGAYLDGKASTDAGVTAEYANGGANITSGAPVRSNDAITLTADVAEGYVIDRWEIIKDGNSEIVQTVNNADYNAATLTLNSVKADTTVKLHIVATEDFEILFRQASLNASLTDYSLSATNVSDGKATRGATIKFTATDSENAAIEKWVSYPTKADYENKTNGQIFLSAVSGYTVENLRGNLYIEAVFIAIGDRTTHELTFYVIDGGDNNTLTAKDAGGNPLQSGREYVEGTAVSFELDLDPTYYVVSWSGAVVSESDPTKATLASLNGDTAVSVTVAEIPTTTYAISYSYGTNGTAAASYGDPSVPFTGSADILIDSAVSIVATPAAGWQVDKWTVNNIDYFPNDETPDDFTINGNTLSFAAKKDMTISVSFKLQAYTLSFGAYLDAVACDEASVTAAFQNGGETITNGALVQSTKGIALTAQVNPGYVIDSWEIITPNGSETAETAGGAKYNGSTLIVSAVTANTVVKLHLAASGTFEVLYRATSADSELTGYNISATNVTDDMAARGATIEFTAIDSASAAIEKWVSYPTKADYLAKTNGQILSNASGVYTVENLQSNLYIEAVFVTIGQQTTYELSYTIVGDNGKSMLTARDSGGHPLQSGSSYAAGTAVTFALDLHETYYVVSWTGATASQGDITTATLASLNADTAVSVTIAEKPTVSWTSPANGSITVKQGETELASGDYVEPNSNVTVTLTPDTGYSAASLNTHTLSFVNETASDVKTATVQVATSDITLTPVFSALDTHTIAYEVVDLGAGVRRGTLSATSARKGMETYDAESSAAGTGSISLCEGGTAVLIAASESGWQVKEWLIDDVLYEIDGEAYIGTVLELPWNVASEISEITVQMVEGDNKVTFLSPQYGELHVTVGDGEITSGAKVASDTEVTFTVTPEYNYEVIAWQVNGVTQEGETGNAFTYTMADVSAHVSAVMRGVELDITVTAGTGGSVTGAPDAIYYGDTMTIIATPDSGYSFQGWYKGGDLIPDASATYNAGAQTDDADYVAKFTSNTDYTVSFGGNNSEMGSLTATKNGQTLLSGANANGGDRIVITATPAEGYRVKEWNNAPDNAVISDDKNTVTIGALGGALDITAVFELTPIWDITITKPTNGTITATVDGQAVTEVPDGTTVTFTVTPDQYYALDEWTGDASSETKTTFTKVITDDYAVGAIMRSIVSYTVKYQVSGKGGTVSASSSEGAIAIDTVVSCPAAGKVTFVAVPAAGKMVAEWTVEDSSGTRTMDVYTNEFTIKNLSDNIVVTVSFEDISTFSAPQSGTGYTISDVGIAPVIEGESGVRKNGNLTFTVIPESGKYLNALTINGYNCLTGTGTLTGAFSITATPNSNGSYTITLKKVSDDISVSITSANGCRIIFAAPENGSFTVKNGSLTISNGYVAAPGTQLTLRAAASSGYSFSGWAEDVAGKASNPLTITVPTGASSMTISAKFAAVPLGGGGGGLLPQEFTVTFETSGGGSIEAQKIAANANATVPKTPKKDGYNFKGWYTDRALSQRFYFDTPIKDNITLYAKWTEKGDANRFSDIDGHWSEDNIRFVVELGLMNGVSDTLFSPDVDISRGMIVTVLHRMEGEPNAATNIAFDDVPKDEWYSEAIFWASENGIVLGYDDNTYRPDRSVTREELITIIGRYVAVKGYELEQNDLHAEDFNDYDDVASYAKEHMKWGVQTGIITGKGNGILDPGGKATRAELAAILRRLYDGIGDQQHYLP